MAQYLKISFIIFCISYISNAFVIPLSRMEFRKQFNSKDFLFDLTASKPISTGLGGALRLADISKFPAVSGEGIAYALVNLDACAVNLHHTHPRAAELLFLITGSVVRIGFAEENGGRTIVNDVTPGKVRFIIFNKQLLW